MDPPTGAPPDAPPQDASTPPAASQEAAPANVDTAPPPPIRNRPLRLEIQRNKPLAKEIEGMEGAEGKVVWLGDEKDPFLALYVENYVGETRGAVLLLHDNEQHPDWPGLLRELRLSFPKHGWSTLSIALPDFRPIPPMLPPLPKPPPPPKAEQQEPSTDPAENKEGDAKPEQDKDDPTQKKETDKKDAENKDGTATGENPPAESAAPAPPPPPPAPVYLQRESEIPVEQFPAEVDRRIRAATRYMIDEGVQHLLIVAFGSTAGLAAHISRTMLINELNGLVLMDPRPYPEARFDLPTDIADLRIATLDVVPEFEASANPLLRKQMTARLNTPQYEMREVRGAAVNFSGYEPYVVKAVRGWANARFRDAPQNDDRKRVENQKRADKAATPVAPLSEPPPAAPPPSPPPGNNTPAPNLGDPIPPPMPG